MSAEAYLWFKSLHIIGVVVWFSGLFYLVRLFIYHEESKALNEELRKAFDKQYSIMERRLANIITTPGMILTISMAACFYNTFFVSCLSYVGQLTKPPCELIEKERRLLSQGQKPIHQMAFCICVRCFGAVP